MLYRPDKIRLALEPFARCAISGERIPPTALVTARGIPLFHIMLYALEIQIRFLRVLVTQMPDREDLVEVLKDASQALELGKKNPELIKPAPDMEVSGESEPPPPSISEVPAPAGVPIPSEDGDILKRLRSRSSEAAPEGGSPPMGVTPPPSADGANGGVPVPLPQEGKPSDAQASTPASEAPNAEGEVGASPSADEETP